MTTRTKPCSVFLITVYLGDVLIKQFDYNKVLSIVSLTYGSTPAEYCIGLEDNSHYHIACRFKDSFICPENYQNILSQHYGVTVHLKFGVKSSFRNFVKYASKNDPNCLHQNVPSSYLSLFKNITDWSRKQNNNFSFRDPFVINHWQKYKVLQGFCAESEKTSSYLKSVYYKGTVSYISEFLTYYNYYVNTVHKLKKKQFYLWGEPNTGKTSLILHLTQNYNVFTPSYPLSKFSFSGLNHSYDCIWFDEYTNFHKILPLLNQLLQGTKFTIENKGAPSVTLTWRKPVFFTSNYAPEKESFLTRLSIFEAQKISEKEERRFEKTIIHLAQASFPYDSQTQPYTVGPTNPFEQSHQQTVYVG